MPHPIYQHRCCESGRGANGMKTCRHCGAEGTFLRWERSTVESMGRFVRVTGLSPMGAGRLMGRRIPLRYCGKCGGVGYVGTPEACVRCETCHGDGMWLEGGEKTRQALQRESRAAIEAEEAANRVRQVEERKRAAAEHRRIMAELGQLELEEFLLRRRLSRSVGAERPPPTSAARSVNPDPESDLEEDER